MRLRLLAMCAAMSMGGGLALSAQMGGPPPGAPVGSAVSPGKAVDEMLYLWQHEVMPAARAMPADKYDFAPSAAIFVPGQKAEFATVRTFGQQVAHLAQANYYFFAAIGGMKPDVDVRAIEKLTKKDDLVAALAASIAFGHKANATITAENAFVAIKAVDGMDTRISLAGFAVAHGYDHYGQMVEYLRMNGIVPPSSAK